MMLYLGWTRFFLQEMNLKGVDFTWKLFIFLVIFFLFLGKRFLYRFWKKVNFLSPINLPKKRSFSQKKKNLSLPQEMDLKSNPKPFVFILHTFLSAKVHTKNAQCSSTSSSNTTSLPRVSPNVPPQSFTPHSSAPPQNFTTQSYTPLSVPHQTYNPSQSFIHSVPSQPFTPHSAIPTSYTPHSVPPQSFPPSTS